MGVSGQVNVARASDGRRYVTCPYRLGSPPVFAQLTVEGNEAAVFYRQGRVLGVLGPGLHSLSPTMTPFLEVAKSSDQRRYECEVIFVTTRDARLDLDGSVGPLTDTSGRAVEFFLLGSAIVATTNPASVVSQGVGVGEAGDAFERIVLQRLMAGIAQRLPYVFEHGLASPTDVTTIGPAVLEAGRGDQLGLAVTGLEVHAVEISRLVSRENRPPAGREAAERRAEVATNDELPGEVTCRFGVGRIPFWDTDFEMRAHVSVVGHFEGDHVPGDKEEWLKEAIRQALRQAAATWTGTVLDLPGRKDEWARYVTRVVAPNLTRSTGLRGRVVLDGVEIDGQEAAELKRRRGARLAGR